jgi:tetratricopeptide (TPR) repeat protein
MDGRTLALMTAGLLGLTAGCTHTSPLRRGEPAPPPAPKPEYDQAGNLKHKAPTYCAFGDMIAGAASAEDKTPEQRRAAREESKLAYRKAIETDPKYLPAYVSLARVQQAGEEYPAAIETFGQAIQLAPTNAALWYDLALCQARMKRWAESVTSLQKACELAPENRGYVGTLGYTLGRAGRVPEALSVLARIHGEAKANYDLARLMRHMNQIPVAKQLAAAALAKDPNLPGAKQLVAELNGQPVNPPAPAPAVHQTAHVEPAEPESPPAAPTVIQATTAKRLVEDSSDVVTAGATVSANQGEVLVGKPVKMPPLPVRRQK